MLEDLAIRYAGRSEHELRLIAYGLAILGAVIAGVLTRSKSELRRAPYFAFSSFLFLAAAATQLVWLGLQPAMTGGYLWALVAVDVIGSIVIGYFFGIIAMARSRDAFGHGRYAALAFIPLANFILLLKGSRNEMSVNRIPTIPLMTGGLGALSGFVMLAAGITLSVTLMTQIDRTAERASSDSVFQAVKAAGVELVIRLQGLETTLAQMADETDAPQVIDEWITLLRVEADATTLRFHYSFDSDADYPLDSFQQLLAQNICENYLVRAVLRSGGVFEYVFFRTDGSKISTVQITREQCNS